MHIDFCRMLHEEYDDDDDNDEEECVNMVVLFACGLVSPSFLNVNIIGDDQWAVRRVPDFSSIVLVKTWAPSESQRGSEP